MNNLDLDVASPKDVADVLRHAADKYRESGGELQSVWQDQNAGKIWNKLAKALETAANRCDKICATNY